MKYSTLLVDIITLFFILLFAYTGVVKLMDVHLFKEQLTSSPLLGAVAGIITWGLPIGELLLVIVLIIPAWRLTGLRVTLGLMTIFTIYVTVILLMDNQITCSCGGIIEELSPKQHVLFNITCVILSGIALLVARKQQPTVRFKWLTSVLTVMLSLFIGWTLFTAFRAPVTVKTGMEGRLLPSFNLLLVDSLTNLNTRDIPTGQPVIVIGFSPWCKHCQAETREILQHIEQFNNTRIYYVTSDPFDQMKIFYQYFGLAKYPNITLGRDTQAFFLPYFKTRGVPFTAIFDSKKRLKQVFSNGVTSNKLTQSIAE
jgi:thiol-disulfide isomerase/thioredoxin